MFAKVLVANRGAIATRIIRTLKKLNIHAIAIYAESDADSLHVRLADEAWSLGEGAAAHTYLDRQKIIAIARQTGAQAIHPGYGFLSENASFVAECEAADIVFIGPTAEQMITFGLKHKARELAQAAGVPLCPGTDLLPSLEDATQAANCIGYPVMLKSTAGGGGIGMQLCHSDSELIAAFDSVKRLGKNNFADDGVFLEKFIAAARHIEVQVFGDGQGTAVAIGERDCSSQRRNQKVVEECPAPNLPEAQRQAMQQVAEQLLASVCYRNAGTVEFIYDSLDNRFYFLEVNTRLQVEHGVTEEVYSVDLVEWMLKQAAGELGNLRALRAPLSPRGHAIQVRVYAEDPVLNFQPCAGLLSKVEFPATSDQVRIDHWIESGIEVPAYFDPMLAKIIVKGDNRTQALARLDNTLAHTHIYGIETNLGYLRRLLQDDTLVQGKMTTRYLNHFIYQAPRIDVLQGGTQTTIQDYPGRQGYWHVGVPTSGPFDSYSFRLGNRLLNNPQTAAGLEITLQGPLLKFGGATHIVITGAAIEAKLDGKPLSLNQVHAINAGQQLHLGRITTGARAYLCVAGGIQCPDYLGAKSTFTLGQFGGHNGRALRAGDVLALSHDTALLAADTGNLATDTTLPDDLLPTIGNHWELRVIYGPHGAPDFFTDRDINTFFATDWEVHYNSSRTGVRLIGPKPEWARSSGGEAGMHPSNIHDNAYAFGTVDFTGDMPVILGPDGPSLGGFVCPATVITADLWKLGQVRAGDKIRFVPIAIEDAVALEKAQCHTLHSLTARPHDYQPVVPDTPIVQTLPAEEFGEDIVYRVAGDHFLLVEYGPLELDIQLRFRAHALMQWLEKNSLPGLRELTPGIRSLQIHYDSQQLALPLLLAHLKQAEQALITQLAELRVPSRIVHLPLSWDDEACQIAIQKYMQSVRANAPWCPSNLEFIRRINGLDSIEAVKDIVFNASYLVMGLGDVYLGAPVATPVDPRHRLVTTKYNPARTWTAENSVGIGGSYLCIYGMEGPGGYQFVGRTLQMWNRYRKTREFQQPWLLNFFDQIRFYPVSAEELQRIRRDFPQGRYNITIEDSSFSLSEYQHFIDQQADSINNFKHQREQAFDQELARWHANGQFNYEQAEIVEDSEETELPEDAIRIDSSVSGSVWQTQVKVGQAVNAGDILLILESMKMEINITAPCAGTVTHLLKTDGARVQAGQTLVVLGN
ncbi:urea carboxylase [Cellvibrio japonicus]|uniref:Biotin carboxylase n=1 Tax=Cellvibrio japonicus (strain Ueda107) TaxID=498211 RepID=B3PBF6_CELJU|nr:urea carboxylase [Cellvibrio japonicus]ACE84124.1 urea amidolyase homolog [Cellvibrio japonicus Ueda107]QEI13075.1 urea carboxylase [Cellvibrio japonicus]QEI16649.1 urea carboxylase [Cellvibrio japonicus]QEI20227.1 urea carboxylase [Cellvibrio japonicus]